MQHTPEDSEDVGSRMIAEGLLRSERRREKKVAKVVSGILLLFVFLLCCVLCVCSLSLLFSIVVCEWREGGRRGGREGDGGE